MTDELKQWDYDRGYDKGKADMLKVIEDIKQEIEDFEEEVFHRPNTDYEAYASVRHCLDIIDRHIGKEQE